MYRRGICLPPPRGGGGAQRRWARADKGFQTIADMASRAGVTTATLEKLAAADAFRSLGLDRRQALWQVKALSNAPPLPLFDWTATRAEGTEADVQLPQMALSEHVVNDYQTLRLSLKAHPMSFLREDFENSSSSSRGSLQAGAGWGSSARTVEDTKHAAFGESYAGSPSKLARARVLEDDESTRPIQRGHARRVFTCAQLRSLKNGAYVQVAGVVLVRQRPGSAKGVVFMTLEDETDVANVVVWPKMLERYRKVVMTARLILIEGRIQRHEDIIHIVSSKLEDKSGWLLRLSEWAADMKAPLANADEVLHPDPGSARGQAADDQHVHPRFSHAPKPHHPRNVRIIPKSRDFH